MTPPALPDALLAVCMFLGAALYTSVGHAGASAYLALMALFGVPPAEMRPTALVLNILVASFASARYLRAGLFRWRVLWPALLGALPMAFLGGAIQLPGAVYRPLVGVVLLVAATRLLWSPEPLGNRPVRDPPVHRVAWADAVGTASPTRGSGSCDADVLGAPQLEHAVQRVGDDAHLGRLTPLGPRAQAAADDALPSRDVGLHQGAPTVA
jgi:Sulfite exporter TauE/SafE